MRSSDGVIITVYDIEDTPVATIVTSITPSASSPLYLLSLNITVKPGRGEGDGVVGVVGVVGDGVVGEGVVGDGVVGGDRVGRGLHIHIVALSLSVGGD